MTLSDETKAVIRSSLQADISYCRSMLSECLKYGATDGGAGWNSLIDRVERALMEFERECAK